MFKRRTPTKICQRRPGRKSRERSELSGHVGKGRELVGIGREMSVSVMGGGLLRDFTINSDLFDESVQPENESIGFQVALI